jgi:hypothetical protein
MLFVMLKKVEATTVKAAENEPLIILGTVCRH